MPVHSIKRNQSRTQRAAYLDEGYLHLEGFVSHEWLRGLRAATAEMIDRSRSVTASNDEFVLDMDHHRHAPRLRRLRCAADRHPAYRSFAFESRVPDLVADLVGPDVKFRECFVNFKASGGGGEVR